jgi:hypothetical protein
MTTQSTAMGPEFESRYGQIFSLIDVVQIGSGTHPTYPMGTVGPFLGGKAPRS